MRAAFTISLFLLLALCVKANIWDNLILGEGVAFHIPKNFSMVLSLSENIKFRILGSTKLDFLSVSLESSALQTLLSSKIPGFNKNNLIFSKINFGNGEMYLNSAFKNCLAVKDKHLDAEFFPRIHQYTTLLTLLVSTKREGEYSKLETSKLLNLIDPSALTKLPIDKIPLDKIPVDISTLPAMPDLNLVLYFNTKTSVLKKIEFLGLNGQKYELQVEEFKEYKFTSEDLKVPNEWQCSKETQKALNEIDFEQILEDITKDHPEIFKIQIFPLVTVGSAISMLKEIKSFSELMDLLQLISRFA